MIISLKKWGNSASIRIPSIILESMNLKVDDQLEIKQEGARIIIEPVSETSYRLEDLISAITPDNLHGRLDFGAPVGKEVL